MSETNFEYIGNELDVFQYATNWKRYWSRCLKPFLGSDILEVGAGLGINTKLLCNPSYNQWLAIEPDNNMITDLTNQQEAGVFPDNCEFRETTIQSLLDTELFDTIMYIDVLEHIKHDSQELIDAATHLSPGGYLIVLSPAYQYLYTSFDKAIGHYRRYTANMMSDITPPECRIEKIFYLDSVGLLASLGNQMFLKQSEPSRQQILFWDRMMVPLSYSIDWIIRYRAGRSVIAVWQKEI
jgi:SAM-dependent methyltransferase